MAFSDVDLNDTHNVTVTKIGSPLGTVTATVSADTVNGTGGVVTWAYDVTATKLEFLAAGEERIETFDVKVKDTHGGSATQTISITLVGTNDDVVLANVDLKGAVTETAGTPVVGATLSNGGTVAFSDADVADLHTVSVAGFNAGASNVGSALGVLTASLAADTVGGTGGSVAWSYSVDAAAVEYLAVGEKP